jgi:hypothetical protein
LPYRLLHAFDAKSNGPALSPNATNQRRIDATRASLKLRFEAEWTMFSDGNAQIKHHGSAAQVPVLKPGEVCQHCGQETPKEAKI